MTQTRQTLYGRDGPTDAAREAFATGAVPVAVYGLGKMGLPLAGVFAEVAGNVVGVDVDPDVVEAVEDGRSHVEREPGLDDLIADCVDDGRLRATTDGPEAAADASVHVIIVPTPITDENEPDLSALDAVVEDVRRGLSPGDLVLVECTVPPRTTADRVTPALAEASGLDAGEFGVAFCPERTSSGRALEDIRGAYPKVVGGVDEASTDAATLVYEEVNDSGVVPVSDATTAEAVKVFEGLYRDVNIALANELATFADELGIDVTEAIDVANTQPFCDIHDPGPGVGGHCIPFYPYFLIEPFETGTPLLETAREVNDAMPAFTVEKLRGELAAEGSSLAESSVLVLGLTYRPGVAETRAAPSREIARRLTEAGADVYGVDPVLDEFDAFDLDPVPLSDAPDCDADGVVLVTPHEEFDRLDWDAVGRDGGSVVIDGRGSLDLSGTDHRVYAIGAGRTDGGTTGDERSEPGGGER